MPGYTEESWNYWSTKDPKFPDDPLGAALNHLAPNFHFGAPNWTAQSYGEVWGAIHPNPGYTPTEEDLSAIDQACYEWDFAYFNDPHTAAKCDCNLLIS